MGRAFQNRKESMAKTAAAKTKVYSKYGREIYVCAKQGGTDPAGNLSLRGLIERARKDQVPAHVIEKAIDKVLEDGVRTADIVGSSAISPIGCKQMTEEIIKRI